MRHLSPLIAFILAFTCASKAQDRPTPEKESVQFDGQTLILAFQNQSPGEGLKEFIPASENINAWTKFAAVHEYPKLTDPKAFANNLLESLKKQNPAAPSRVIENSSTGEVIVDFITWPENNAYVEFNVFKYAKKEGVGIIAFQYALRKYGNATDWLKGFKPTRERLVNLMAKGDFKIVK